jgi:hypothetical protein
LKDNVPGTPLWLNEGLAEFYGTMQFSAAKRRWARPSITTTPAARSGDAAALDALLDRHKLAALQRAGKKRIFYESRGRWSIT